MDLDSVREQELRDQKRWWSYIFRRWIRVLSWLLHFIILWAWLIWYEKCIKGRMGQINQADWTREVFGHGLSEENWDEKRLDWLKWLVETLWDSDGE